MARSASRKKTARHPTVKQKTGMSTDSEWYVPPPMTIDKAELEEVKKGSIETKKETEAVKKEVVELKSDIKDLKNLVEHLVAAARGA